MSLADALRRHFARHPRGVLHGRSRVGKDRPFVVMGGVSVEQVEVEARHALTNEPDRLGLLMLFKPSDQDRLFRPSFSG